MGSSSRPSNIEHPLALGSSRVWIRLLRRSGGIDPMYVANEGKLVCAVPADEAVAALAAMRGHEYGAEAAVIGEVTAEHPGLVTMRGTLGAERIVDRPVGEQLPRIC